jgi:hypothetical protein
VKPVFSLSAPLSRLIGENNYVPGASISRPTVCVTSRGLEYRDRTACLEIVVAHFSPFCFAHGYLHLVFRLYLYMSVKGYLSTSAVMYSDSDVRYIFTKTGSKTFMFRSANFAETAFWNKTVHGPPPEILGHDLRVAREELPSFPTHPTACESWYPWRKCYLCNGQPSFSGLNGA